MRSALTALSLLLLAGCSGPATEVRTGPPEATALEPVAKPTALSCDGEAQVSSFDYGGDRSFTELLTDWTAELGRPWVDRASRKVWFLREDGTAHTVIDWTHTRPQAGRDWWVDGYEQCDDAAQWTKVAAATTAVELEVGHCWVEPLAAGGRSWDVAREDQFGWGGPQPRRISGTGTLMPAGEVAVYVDEQGGRLTLVPADDGWALTRGGCD